MLRVFLWGPGGGRLELVGATKTCQMLPQCGTHQPLFVFGGLSSDHRRPFDRLVGLEIDGFDRFWALGHPSSTEPPGIFRQNRTPLGRFSLQKTQPWPWFPMAVTRQVSLQTLKRAGPPRRGGPGI